MCRLSGTVNQRMRSNASSTTPSFVARVATAYWSPTGPPIGQAWVGGSVTYWLLSLVRIGAKKALHSKSTSVSLSRRGNDHVPFSMIGSTFLRKFVWLSVALVGQSGER